MAGLQDISPMVAKRCVTSAVRAPMRAAAAAASQPAWLAADDDHVVAPCSNSALVHGLYLVVPARVKAVAIVT